jgi:hypothetical protein
MVLKILAIAVRQEKKNKKNVEQKGRKNLPLFTDNIIV